MALSSDLLVEPQFVKIRFSLEPALNIVDSMVDVLRVEEKSGFGEWAVQTWGRLTPEQRKTHRLVFEGLSGILYQTLEKAERSWPDFPSYVDYLTNLDPVTVRDSMLHMYREKTLIYAPDHPITDMAAFLANRDVFFQWLRQTWPDEQHDPELYGEVHRLLNNPAEMLNAVVSTLRGFWQDHVAAEWQRVRPMLLESIAAFERLNLHDVTAAEALRLVTTREVPTSWDYKFEEVREITFIPSAHIGPYIVIMGEGEKRRIIFGARLPKGTATRAASSALGRSELLTRLNALADDTRLRILELLTQENELCAQDIIAKLDLSQSTISRHLSQLAATGYISERRRDVAKCYTLNVERVQDTLSALEYFLLKREPVHQ